MLPRRETQSTYRRYVEFQRDEREDDREIFDRVAYAMRLLRIVSPRVRVAVCEGTEKLKVERGGTLPWAVLSIPRDASRYSIVEAVLRLAGKEATPFLRDLLLSDRTS